MSVGAVCKTSLNDEITLVESLKEIYGESNVEVLKEGIQVRGFASDRRPTILVKIPGLYGTAGFSKGEDGNYELIYDSTDRNRLKKLLPEKKGDTTHNYLNQVYSRNKVVNGMKAIKGKLVKNQVEADGSIRLRVRTVSYGE